MTRKYEYNKAWRQAHPERRAADRKRHYAQTQGAPNTRRPWTSADLNRIVADDRPSDRVLSAELGRSMQAISIMRSRIRKDSV